MTVYAACGKLPAILTGGIGGMQVSVPKKFISRTSSCYMHGTCNPYFGPSLPSLLLLPCTIHANMATKVPTLDWDGKRALTHSTLPLKPFLCGLEPYLGYPCNADYGQKGPNIGLWWQEDPYTLPTPSNTIHCGLAPNLGSLCSTGWGQGGPNTGLGWH